MNNSFAPTSANAVLDERSRKHAFLSFAMLGVMTIGAHAATNDGVVGPYARVEVGRTHLSLSSTLPLGSTDDRSSAARIFGGYRLNQNFGIEAGYAALGSFNASANVGGANVTQNGRARSIFGVATGRLPLGDSFALHSRLGVSFGKVSGTNVLPEREALVGSANSMLIGVGAEYKPRSNIALTVNYDSYGKLAKNVKADSLVFGVHFWF